MTPLYGHTEAVVAFVRSLVPNESAAFKNCTAIGIVDDDGKLVAGVVYSDWFPKRGTIELSGAALTPRWLTRAIMRAVLGYPFRQLGCQMVYMRVSETNGRLIDQLKRFGCEGFAIPRMRGPETAEIVFTLTREQYDERW